MSEALSQSGSVSWFTTFCPPRSNTALIRKESVACARDRSTESELRVAESRPSRSTTPSLSVVNFQWIANGQVSGSGLNTRENLSALIGAEALNVVLNPEFGKGARSSRMSKSHRSEPSARTAWCASG
ncbi:hypothetical protein D5S17_30995 [Pseudonocardiaceae bacterium YIM PH 21723]|nr:hypothetical protein D5S17_30995 [Pseudonocardiaceae bacterium YIM PH 21723]